MGEEITDKQNGLKQTSRHYQYLNCKYEYVSVCIKLKWVCLKLKRCPLMVHHIHGSYS